MLNIKNTFRIFPDEYKKKSLAFIIFLLIATVLETIGVGIIFPLIDIAIDGEISNNFINNNFSFILSKLEKKNLFQNLAILVILLYIFKSIYMLAFNFWQAKFQFSLYKFISEKFYYGYLHQSISFINKKNSSIILRNTMMECKNYAHLISLFLKLVVEITLALFIFSLVVLVDPQKTIMVSISIILLSSIYYSLTSGKLLRYSSERVETISGQVKILNESVSGIRDIKLKSSENFFINLYKLYIQKFVSAAYKQQFIIESPKIIIELIFILVFLIGLIFYINNNKDIVTILPLLGLYVIAALKLLPSLMRILNFVQQIKGLDATINVLSNEFSNLKFKNILHSNKSNFIFKKEINISNIFFSYEEGKNVISNFSKTIKKNSCIGIIGKSGSGKSTIIDLITGLISPSKGIITVDGIDIKKNLRGWQSKIGYVSQSVFLLDGSIKANVAFGIKNENIDEKLLRESLKGANILSFVDELDKGVDTKVAEKGVKISGGQRQRIAIARELYRKPEVLILDEATSALDEETENQIMEFLDNMKNKLTIIVVSHRKNTLKKCDEILQLK